MAASAPSPAPSELASPAGPPVPDDAVREQLERVLESPQFRSSELLKRFLRHVVEETLAGNDDRIKESVIGSDLFGRGADFDPRVDNIVRVSAHRLRSRLDDYYAGPGASDPVRIDVPRGHYTPAFEAREAVEAKPAPVVIPKHAATAVPSPAPRPRGFPAMSLALGAALLALGIGLGYVGHAVLSPADSTAAELAPELAEFWGPMLENQETPVIVAYSNPVFLRNKDGDLVRYHGDNSLATGVTVTDPNLLASLAAEREQMREPLRFNATYTGTGEVQAVHDLTRVLVSGGARTVVRRSRLLLVSEFRDHDVVVIGSPVGNRLLTDLWGDTAYRFSDPGSIIHLSDPGPGEPSSYFVENDPETGARVVDYALVSVLPSIQPGRRLIVLAGCSTAGTRGAADFVTSPEGVRQLTAAFEGRLPRFFQALLKTPIIEDQVSPSQLLSVRPVNSQSALIPARASR